MEYFLLLTWVDVGKDPPQMLRMGTRLGSITAFLYVSCRMADRLERRISMSNTAEAPTKQLTGRKKLIIVGGGMAAFGLCRSLVKHELHHT